MKRVSVILKTIITILIVIVIPTFIAVNYLGKHILSYFVSELHNQNITNLELVKQNEENYLNSMLQNIIKVSGDPLFNNIQGIKTYSDLINSTHDIIMVNNISSHMRDYIYGQQDIQDVYLVPEDSDFLITIESGIKQINNYYDSGWIKVYLEFQKSGEKEFYFSRKLSYNNSAKAEDANISRNIVTYFYRLTPLTTNLKGCIIVNIYEDFLNESINKFNYSKEGTNFIVNKNGQVITSANKALLGKSISDKSFFKDMAANPSQNGYIIDKTEDGKNVYTFVKSDSHNWIYINCQSLQMQTEKINQLSGKWAVIIDLVLILGLIITIITVYLLSRPLRKMIKEIVVGGNFSKDDLRDEYAIISRAFASINSEQKKMKEQLIQRQEESKELYLLSLIKGTYEKNTDKEELNFPYSNFRVAILSLDGNLLDFSSEQKYYFKLSIIKYVEEEFSQIYKSYAVIYDDTSVAAIINFHNESETCKDLISKFEAIKAKVKENIGMSISVGLGEKYSSVNLIKSSASEAAAAIERRIIRGNGSIIPWSPEIVLTGKFYYPYDTEKRILNELSSNNISAIGSELNNLIKEVKSMCELNSYNIFNIYYQLISATLKYLIDSNVNVNNIFGNINHIYNDVMNKTVIDDIHEVMLEFYKKICNYRVKSSDNKTYFNKIVSYLKRNFRQEINFEDMSREINISYSYIRKIIKDVTDKTINEYLIELRIEEAKRLLTQSNLTIIQIADAIGFSNIQSFNRCFKKYEGVTGSEFRKNSWEAKDC